MHFRDFNPGDDIDHQIIRSVDNSRKTLLILTKHFLVSEWCQYGMRVARNKLQAEGKDVVVPILLAELPEEHGNPSVKNLIREKTYLRWETSLGGQEYFWEKLAFAISGKQACFALRHTNTRVLTSSTNTDNRDDNGVRIRHSVSKYSILRRALPLGDRDSVKYGTFDNT